MPNVPLIAKISIVLSLLMLLGFLPAMDTISNDDPNAVMGGFATGLIWMVYWLIFIPNTILFTMYVIKMRRWGVVVDRKVLGIYVGATFCFILVHTNGLI